MTRLPRSVARMVVVVLALMAMPAACGDDDRTADRSTGTDGADPSGVDGCNLAALEADEPVRLRYRQVAPAGPSEWFDAIKAWDRGEPGVELDIDLVPNGGYAEAAREAFDEPPVAALRRVPWNSVGALAQAGVIRPLDACLDAAGVDVESFEPSARLMGVVDGERYGIPANLAVTLLVYDRAAFRRAGLDPDDPPATFDEFAAAATALRDRAGYELPVDWAPGSFALASLDYGSARARAAAASYVSLGQQGLLLRPPRTSGGGSEFEPIADGRVAVQLTGMQTLWTLGDAIANGQAPGIDLGVMALPSTEGARIPVGGDLLVLDATATDAQLAAAARFLAWSTGAASQSVLHVMTDDLPLSDAATRTRRVRDYWSRLPLHEAAWRLVREHGVGATGTDLELGVARSTSFMLAEAAFDGEPFDSVWQRVIEQVEAARAEARSDPEGLFECVFPPPELPPPETLDACV